MKNPPKGAACPHFGEDGVCFGVTIDGSHPYCPHVRESWIACRPGYDEDGEVEYSIEFKAKKYVEDLTFSISETP